MFRVKIIKLFVILMFIACLLCGCKSDRPAQQKLEEAPSQETYSYSTENSSFKNTMYKYINGCATFSYKFNNGYVICTDSTYSDSEKYYGKVRWCDEEGEGIIKSVSQVISADSEEIYNKTLSIDDLRDENVNNHIWDYVVNYEHSVKAQCSDNAKVECYIKLIDSNNIEYHVMLTPVEKFNHDGYEGAAVYIIDKDNNKEFWYDDLVQE